MFLYPYPHPVHCTEVPNWAQQQQEQQENRMAFSPEMFNNGNGKSLNNGKNGLFDLNNGTGAGPSSSLGVGHQHSMSPSVTSSLPGTSHNFQQFEYLEYPADQKPLVGEYVEMKVEAIAGFNGKEKCRTCGEELMPAELIQHMRNHMGPRRCEICNYEAPTKHHLREHLNTHTGLKPYKCQFCDKSFAAKNSLRVHTMYLHTKIRAHQCHFCDQRFVTTSERKSHELVHTDKCPICQMSFRLRGHLRQHMKSHANAAFHHKKEKPHPQ